MSKHNQKSSFSPAVRIFSLVLTVLVSSSAVVWLIYFLINLLSKGA